MKLTLVAKTHEGRQMLRAWDRDTFRVQEVKNNVKHDTRFGPWYLLDTGYWLIENKDKDFRIEKAETDA